MIIFVCYRGGQLTTFTHNQFNVTINGTMRDSDDYALGKLGNWTMTVIEIIILQIVFLVFTVNSRIESGTLFRTLFESGLYLSQDSIHVTI